MQRKPNNCHVQSIANSKREFEIITASHVHNLFVFFVIMERIRKGSDLPKTVQPTTTLHFVEFFTWCARLMYDVARACLMNSVRSRDKE